MSFQLSIRPPLTRCLDWFEVLDEDNLPVLTEREVLQNLQARCEAEDA